MTALIVLTAVALAVAAAMIVRRRRGLLGAGLLAALLVAGGIGATVAPTATFDELDKTADNADEPCFTNSPVAAPYSQPLTIPPVAVPVVSSGTEDRYVIEQRAVEREIIPGVKTPLWSYDGSVPGPTIMARRGRAARVTYVNNLPADEDLDNIVLGEPDQEHHHSEPSATTVHMHGINGDFRGDGYPTDTPTRSHLFGPGEAFTYLWPNNEYQRPSTLWYHDHAIHATSRHAYRGLAGMYILKDDREDAMPLPGSPAVDGTNGYGVYDIPLSISNPMIDHRTGKLWYDNCDWDGAYGDIIAVNGRQQPKLDVAARKYRFRLLNTADARQFELALRVSRPDLGSASTFVNEPMTMIATDQGFLRNPITIESLRFVPAERPQLVIDFGKYPVGTRLELVNLLAMPTDRKLHPMMAFDVTHSVADPSSVPAQLSADLDPASPQPDEQVADLEPAVDRGDSFKFGRGGGDAEWSINNEIFDEDRDDVTVGQDTNVRWVIENNSGGWGHPFHPHLGKFRVISIEGREPFPGEMEGWKDVVWLGPGNRIVIEHQLWNYNGRYVMHCHNMSHEDNDMMAQIRVLPIGDAPDALEAAEDQQGSSFGEGGYRDEIRREVERLLAIQRERERARAAAAARLRAPAGPAAAAASLTPPPAAPVRARATALRAAARIRRAVVRRSGVRLDFLKPAGARVAVITIERGSRVVVRKQVAMRSARGRVVVTLDGRSLTRGAYRVRVRLGATRATLGPATSRSLRIV